MPNKELDLESTPDDAFDHDPRKVKAGELIIHIRKGNDATFYAPNISDYTATALFSDLVAYQGQPVQLTVIQTAYEYLIEVPEFTCTMVVCIDISQ